MNEGEIDVTEVKEKLDRGDNFVLIDVREPHEYQICNIPAAKLIPLGEVPQRLGEFDKEADIVIHCKSGVRSAKACGILQRRRLPARPQHEGRDPGLERPGGSQRAEVLIAVRRRASTPARSVRVPRSRPCSFVTIVWR